MSDLAKIFNRTKFMIYNRLILRDHVRKLYYMYMLYES